MFFRLARRSSVQGIVNLSSSRIIKESHFCSVFTHSQRCNNILDSVSFRSEDSNSSLTTNTILRTYSTHQNDKRPGDNPGIVKRFKQMFKDYWYVLLPVHVATSAVWLGGFYISLKSGVDIVGMLESLGTSERILDYLRHSEAGYIALSYACYKVRQMTLLLSYRLSNSNQPFLLLSFLIGLTQQLYLLIPYWEGKSRYKLLICRVSSIGCLKEKNYILILLNWATRLSDDTCKRSPPRPGTPSRWAEQH